MIQPFLKDFTILHSIRAGEFLEGMVILKCLMSAPRKGWDIIHTPDLIVLRVAEFASLLTSQRRFEHHCVSCRLLGQKGYQHIL